MKQSKHQLRIEAAKARPASETTRMRDNERRQLGSRFARLINGFRPGAEVELSGNRKYRVAKDGSLRRLN